MSKAKELVNDLTQYLEINQHILSYNDFEIFVDGTHFSNNLKKRGKIDLGVFKSKYLHRICDKIYSEGLKVGNYAIICDKFIVIAKFTPYKFSNKKHDLFLITVLSRNMKVKDIDNKIILEYYSSLYDVDVKVGEATIREGLDFGEVLVFTGEGIESTHLYVISL